MPQTPKRVAAEIRAILKRDGSAEHAKGVQWIFKEEIKSHGWYAADLRRVAKEYRRMVLKEEGIEFLVRVADVLFAGKILEEKGVAVLLLESVTHKLNEEHFVLFESWIDRVSSWADHDALVHYLIAPMIAAEPQRAGRVFDWAKSKDRWRRRAACVALIQGTRQKMFFPQIVRLSNQLLCDEDDMVQKGLGWLLRETAKRDPRAHRSILNEDPCAHLPPGSADGMRDALGARQECRPCKIGTMMAHGPRRHSVCTPRPQH